MNRFGFSVLMMVVFVVLINISSYVIAKTFDQDALVVESWVVYVFLGIAISEWSWLKYER